MKKKLSETKREIVIGRDKCKKCKELLEWLRIYPFPVYCSTCHKDMEFEDDIIFGDTKAHIQIKGNKKAVEKMLKLVEEIEDQGVEIRLTIEKSTGK